jgi:hypothetical protein
VCTQEGERKSEYDDSYWTFISLQLLKVMLLLDGTELNGYYSESKVLISHVRTI